MFYTQDGSWCNAQNIEMWRIKPLKGDLHQLVAIGNAEHQIHVAPEANCQDVQRQIVSHVKEGHELDLRGRDQEHFEAAKPKPRIAVKPKPRTRSKSTETTTPTETSDDS